MCTAAYIDSAIADVLGLRWAFIGPFETIDLNSPRGVRGYCYMLGPLYHDLAREQADPREWSEPLVARIERERRSTLPMEALTDRQAWRDHRLAKLVNHKRRADAEEAGQGYEKDWAHSLRSGDELEEKFEDHCILKDSA